MEVGNIFTIHYLQVWRQCVGEIERYPWSGMDYRGDPQISRTNGWDDRGKYRYFVYVCFLLLGDRD